MSISHSIPEIEYPESDGLPMGETDLHRKWIQYIDDVLCQRYRGERVYIGSDLLIYYEEGHPTRFLVPDNFVVLNCDTTMRRVFKTWEECRVPDVVFEVTSRSTSDRDQAFKLVTYEQIGVKEYFMYDPSQSYLEESLQGFRLEQGSFLQIPETKNAINHHAIDCQTLGIRLSLDEERLVLSDILSGERLLTEAETERQAKEAERQAKEVERQAKEAERQAKETERRAKETEREAKEKEIASRTAAEARIAELEAEIRALRQERDK